jgi:hypothetical protein
MQVSTCMSRSFCFNKSHPASKMSLKRVEILMKAFSELK